MRTQARRPAYMTPEKLEANRLRQAERRRQGEASGSVYHGRKDLHERFGIEHVEPTPAPPKQPKLYFEGVVVGPQQHKLIRLLRNREGGVTAKEAAAWLYGDDSDYSRSLMKAVRQKVRRKFPGRVVMDGQRFRWLDKAPAQA